MPQLFLLNVGMLMLAQESKLVAQSTNKEAWKLTVNTERALLISLQAERTPLVEVVNELQKQIALPITVSVNLQKNLVSAHFADANLLTALGELAPQGYVDFVVAGGWDAQPQVLTIYLQDQQDAAPVLNASVPARAESFSFGGSTEIAFAGTAIEHEKKTEQFLAISRVHDFVSIQARHQPLNIVLAKLAASYEIPVDFRAEDESAITFECKSLALLDVMKLLPTNVQFFYRIKLHTLENKPLSLMVNKMKLRSNENE